MNIFTQDQLNRVVQEAIIDIPSGHTNAVVGSVDATGAQVIIGMKLGNKDQWKITGAIAHDWSGNNSIGAKVMYSW